VKKILILILLMSTGFLYAKENKRGLSEDSIQTKDIQLTADNVVVLRDVIDDVSIVKVKKQLLELNSQLKSGYPIYLFLFTPGGNIQSGLELIEFIKGLNRPVHTISAFSASMGFQLVQHLGERYILNYGILMSHPPKGGAEGEFGQEDSQLDNRLGLWIRRVKMMDELTVKRTKGKQTYDSYTRSYQKELWMNGPEAVQRGYADSLANVSCSDGLKNKVEEDIIDLFVVRVKVKYSGCPMIMNPLEVSLDLLTNKGWMSKDDFFAKGGKLGKDCGTASTDQFYYGNNGTPIVKEQEICAYDKELTLEKMSQTLTEKIKYLNRDYKKNIQYSY
jgi:ATP-dependent protease ClpP protease subunit